MYLNEQKGTFTTDLGEFEKVSINQIQDSKRLYLILFKTRILLIRLGDSLQSKTNPDLRVSV